MVLETNATEAESSSHSITLGLHSIDMTYHWWGDFDHMEKVSPAKSLHCEIVSFPFSYSVLWKWAVRSSPHSAHVCLWWRQGGIQLHLLEQGVFTHVIWNFSVRITCILSSCVYTLIYLDQLWTCGYLFYTLGYNLIIQYPFDINMSYLFIFIFSAFFKFLCASPRIGHFFKNS